MTPTSATVTVGDPAIPLSATLLNSTETIVWAVVSGPGSVSATSGATTTYVPPASGAGGAVVVSVTAGALTTAVNIDVLPQPVVQVDPAAANATIGGQDLTFTATLLNFTTTPSVMWTLTGPGSLSTASGSATVYTPPASGGASTATLTATADGRSASATITIGLAPTLTLSRTSFYAGYAQQTPLTATLSGSTDPITWSVTGDGSLDVSTGASVTYTAPNFGPARTITVTATAGALTASCTVSLYRISIESDPVFVSGRPVRLNTVIDGAPDTLPVQWQLISGAGALSATTGASIDYLPPHDPATAGTSVLIRHTVDVAPANNLTLLIANRQSRGATIFAWGTVPLVISGSAPGTVLTNKFTANGPTAAVFATRTATGVASVRVDGLSINPPSASSITHIELTPLLSTARCRLASASGDTFVVECFNDSGALTNSAFDFRVVQTGKAAGGQIMAFGQAGGFGATVSGPQTPTNAYSAVGAMTVTNTAVGAYTLRLPTGVVIGSVQVTTVANIPANRCSVATFVAEEAQVTCVSVTGAPSNAMFNFSVAGNQGVSEAGITQLIVDAQPTLPTFENLGVRAWSRGGNGPLVARSGPGVYELRHRDRELAPEMITHVTALDANRSCDVYPWIVRCYDEQGNLADSRFEYVSIGRPRPSVANVSGFAWVVVPNTNSTPPAATTFNASGGAVTVTRSAAGTYRVTFANLDLTNSNAMATAYGANRRCAVSSVLGNDVDVQCYSPTNTLSDSLFFVSVSSWNRASSGRVMAWGRVNSQGTAPNAERGFNPAGGITSARTGIGTYTVTFTGLATADMQNLQVSAENGSRFCAVTGLAVPTVTVQCHDGAGVADSDFSVTVFADQATVEPIQTAPRSEVLAFAWLNEPSTASYTPWPPLAYNSGNQSIVATRTAPGVYAVRFPGLSLQSGVAQVTPTVTTNRCTVLSHTGDTVNVRCFDIAGLGVDTPYLLNFVR